MADRLEIIFWLRFNEGFFHFLSNELIKFFQNHISADMIICSTDQMVSRIDVLLKVCYYMLNMKNVF